MSTKAMGRMYTGNGGPSFGLGGRGGFDDPSWLSSLFGQDAVTGGGDTPYQGSGGIFGGQSRRLATLLEAQRQSQLRGIQADKDFIKLQNELNEHAEGEKARHAKEQSIQDTVNKLAERHDVHPSIIMDAASPLSKFMTAGAELQQGAVNRARMTDQYDKSVQTGENYRGAGMNPDLQHMVVPFGGEGIMATPGGMASVSGGASRQEQWVDPLTGLGRTLQENSPGSFTLPVDRLQYDQAQNLPRPNPNFPASQSISGVSAMPGMTSPSRGMTLGGNQSSVGNTNGTSSTGVSPVPSNSQPPAGIGATNSTTSSNPNNFYTPEEMNQPLAQGLRAAIGRLGQGFNPASLTGAGYSGVNPPPLPQQVSPNPGVSGDGVGTPGYYQQLMQKLAQQQQMGGMSIPAGVNGGAAMPSSPAGVSPMPMIGPGNTMSGPNRFGQYPGDMDMQAMMAALLGGQ